MAEAGSTCPLTLELLIKPPSLLRPGISPALPIVVAVKPETGKENGVGTCGVGDMSGMWALVCLLSEDGSEVLVPPQSGLLTGRMVASIHAPSAQAEPNRQIVGYAHFPDLAITTPGAYRLRVSLIDMDSNGPSYLGSREEGRNVRSIVSGVVRVVTNAAPELPGKCVESLHMKTLTKQAAGEIELVDRLRASGVLRE